MNCEWKERKSEKLTVSNALLREQAGIGKNKNETLADEYSSSRSKSEKLTVSNALLREQAGIGKNKNDTGRRIQQQQETERRFKLTVSK